MSALAALAIVAANTGAGIYTEAGYDVLFSDRLGLMARGQRIIGEVGIFRGKYMGSYEFGSYWLYGVGMSWEPIDLVGLRKNANQDRENTFAIQFFYPHLTLTRGVDLFKVGLNGKVRLGPVWSVTDAKDFYNEYAVWGGQLSGELQGSYNVCDMFKIAPRVGAGLLWDAVRISYQFTMGIGIYLGVPVRSVAVDNRADDWEADYPPPSKQGDEGHP